MGFRFREFAIYGEIRTLISNIYLTTNLFPKYELLGLTSQIRRAAVSILLNLAEGSGKKSDADFNRFILISTGSLHELAACLDIARDLRYITPLAHQRYLDECELLARKLYGFSKKLKS